MARCALPHRSPRPVRRPTPAPRCRMRPCRSPSAAPAPAAASQAPAARPADPFAVRAHARTRALAHMCTPQHAPPRTVCSSHACLPVRIRATIVALQPRMPGCPARLQAPGGPDFMAQMQNPAIMGMLNDPELLRTMLQNNPMVQQVRWAGSCV